jgi:hypothetical protein
VGAFSPLALCDIFHCFPWNIAAQFNVDMNLSESGIKGMLEDYEDDHHSEMDNALMSKLL